FTVEDFLALGGKNLSAGALSMREGPAWSLRDHEAILAVGGVRVSGIGQAWLKLSDRGRSRPKAVLEACRAGLVKAVVEHGLYRIYGEADPQVGKANFFEHMGFVQLAPQDQLYVWPKVPR
ncbi:MAG: hypothetical protein GWN87_16650, partial [Desulfuromonadales bacterium]|nr:hypothetical protein [Desulfuromonadales bacterium]